MTDPLRPVGTIRECRVCHKPFNATAYKGRPTKEGKPAFFRRWICNNCRWDHEKKTAPTERLRGYQEETKKWKQKRKAELLSGGPLRLPMKWYEYTPALNHYRKLRHAKIELDEARDEAVKIFNARNKQPKTNT
jgi:Zn-finger protein